MKYTDIGSYDDSYCEQNYNIIICKIFQYLANAEINKMRQKGAILYYNKRKTENIKGFS